MDDHQFLSLLVRDWSIIAKRHAELARDYRAIAGTYRRALADTVPSVLPAPQEQDGGVVQIPLPNADADPFGPDLQKDYD